MCASLRGTVAVVKPLTDTATALLRRRTPEHVHSVIDEEKPDHATFTTTADGDYMVDIECIVEEGEIRFVSATFRPRSGPSPMPGTRLFARLRMGAIEQRVADQVRRPMFQRMAPEPWKRVAMSPARLGRRAKPDDFYALWAKEYVDALAKHPAHPVKAMIENHADEHYTRAAIVGYLNKARVRGLLGSAPKGRAGGELTDKGRAALKGKD